MTATNPRFQVQQPGGPFMRVVWDTWLATEAARFYSGEGPRGESAEVASNRAQLLAETRASELNLGAADPLGFVEKLSAWVDEAINEGTHPREVVEDLSKILGHYGGQIRGSVVEPLDMTKTYTQPVWVNAHGLGA